MQYAQMPKKESLRLCIPAFAACQLLKNSLETWHNGWAIFPHPFLPILSRTIPRNAIQRLWCIPFQQLSQIICYTRRNTKRHLAHQYRNPAPFYIRLLEKGPSDSKQKTIVQWLKCPHGSSEVDVPIYAHSCVHTATGSGHTSLLLGSKGLFSRWVCKRWPSMRSLGICARRGSMSPITDFIRVRRWLNAQSPVTLSAGPAPGFQVSGTGFRRVVIKAERRLWGRRNRITAGIVLHLMEWTTLRNEDGYEVREKRRKARRFGQWQWACQQPWSFLVSVKRLALLSLLYSCTSYFIILL